MRVLVTGGTGYLGQAVVRAILSSGHSVVVFSRRPPETTQTIHPAGGWGHGNGGLNAPALAGAQPASFDGDRLGAPDSAPSMRHVRGDVRSIGDVISAAAGCDAICHVAALVSIRQSPSEFETVNVGGLRNVLAAAREAGVGRIVYTSSFLAYPPAGGTRPLEANDYQRTKAAALLVARAAAREGAPVVIVSPGVIYGPGLASEGNLVGRLLRDHLDGRLPGLVGPDRTWSFSFVEDVARGHVLALERGTVGAEYGLGGPNLPQSAPFEWLEQRTGRRRPRCIPHALATVIGAFEEARAAVTGSVPLATRGAVEIFKHDWPVDSRRSEEELGYAITPLDTGLESTLGAAMDAAPGRRA